MPTIAIESTAPRHKKVRRLSDRAFRLWISATCHARDMATDGELCDDDLDLIPRCPTGRQRAETVQELVEAGLWEVRPEGWQIHDYGEWNELRDQIQRKRSAARERMAKLRDGSDDVRVNKQRSSGSVRDGRSRSRSTTESESENLVPDPEGSAEGNQPPDVPENPTSFAEAMRLPPADRARRCLERPDLAEWLEPHRWPEVLEIAGILTPGRKLAPWPRDKGVQAVVERLCDFKPAKLAEAARRVKTSAWWRQGGAKGLTSLTHEVASRALDASPGESSVERALERMGLEAANG
jgi:hypothetical protein